MPLSNPRCWTYKTEFKSAILNMVQETKDNMYEE